MTHSKIGSKDRIRGLTVNPGQSCKSCLNLSGGSPLFTKLLLTVATVCIASTAAFSQTKLLRFPDIRGNRVVFTYAGDLWTAPTSGGSAVRLTSHPGVELFGKFSPDGKWIAFTGQYDGDEQVYVVPTSGGEP